MKKNIYVVLVVIVAVAVGGYFFFSTKDTAKVNATSNLSGIQGVNIEPTRDGREEFKKKLKEL